MKKRIFKASLFVLIMMATFLSGTVFAESGSCGNSATWEYSDGVLTISGTGAMSDYSSSSSNRSPWYQYATEIKTIRIESGITKIGAYAFYNAKVEEVSIPDTITSIGKNAFYYCAMLENVQIPDGVTRVEDSTFSRCTSLKNVRIPDGVTYIGTYAFYYCTSLETLEIPDSVTEFGYYTFSYSGLKSFNIPASLTTYVSYMFFLENCSELETVTASANNTKFSSENGVLYNKNKTYIQFYPPKKTDTEYVVPETVTSISTINNPYIKSITIPRNVSSAYGFSGELSGLEEILVDSTSTYFTSEDGVLYDKNKRSIYAFPRAKAMTGYTLPSTVRTIESYAFSKNESIVDFTVPEQVTNIYGNAFSECTNLKTITLSGNDSINIQPNAFENCQNFERFIVTNPSYSTLRVIDGVLIGQGGVLISYPSGKKDAEYIIPDAVESLGEGAFANNKNLKKVVLGHYEQIPNKAFYGCSALEEVDMKAYTSTRLLSIGEEAFRDCDKLKTVTIPHSVTTIKNYAFSYCDNLEVVNLPQNIENIYSNAFYNSSRIKEANYPKTQEDWSANVSVGSYNEALTGKLNYDVEMIKCRYDQSYNSDGSMVFTLTTKGTFIVEGIGDFKWGWDGLDIQDEIKTAIVKEGITRLPEGAFNGCSNLTSVSLPSTLTDIPVNAFYGCRNLTEFVIPENVTHLGHQCFANCQNIQTLIVPEGVKKLPRYFRGSISYSENPPSIYIPKTVTYIEEYAVDANKVIIYYGGSEEDWANITIEDNNRSLLRSDTVIHYNTEGIRGIKLSNPEKTETGWRADYSVTNAYYDDAFSAKLYVALYDKNDNLLDLVSDDISLASGTRESSYVNFTGNINTADYVKAFVWDETEGKLKPVSDSKKIGCYERETIENHSLGAEIHYSATTNPAGVQEFTYDEGCDYLELTFTDDTYLGTKSNTSYYDTLIVYDGEDNVIDKFTYKSLAGRVVKVPGNTVKLYLDFGTSDRSQTSRYYLDSLVACKKLNK